MVNDVLVFTISPHLVRLFCYKIYTKILKMLPKRWIHSEKVWLFVVYIVAFCLYFFHLFRRQKPQFSESIRWAMKMHRNTLMTFLKMFLLSWRTNTAKLKRWTCATIWEIIWLEMYTSRYVCAFVIVYLLEILINLFFFSVSPGRGRRTCSKRAK